MAARKSTTGKSPDTTTPDTAADGRPGRGWYATTWASSPWDAPPSLTDLTTRPKTGRRGARTPPAGSPPVGTSKRALKAARVARRAAYREAVLMAAAGARLVNLDALRATGLKASCRRPRKSNEDVGGMDAGLEAMEKAAGRDIPTENDWFQGVVGDYHDGLDVWHERVDRRAAKAKEEAEAAKAAEKAAKAAAKVDAPTGRRRPR